jgi:RNA polymerase sigma factor (sigma-70 family)
MVKENNNADQALMEALKTGNSQTLRYIYESHWPMALKFVLNNSGLEEDAKELYQEAVILLYEKSLDPTFTLTCSIKTYIYSICRNKWLNELRKKKKVIDIEYYQEDLAHDTSENEQFDVKQKKVVDTILGMGDPCQSLLIGYYYDKLSFEHLAQKMNYQSPNVAKQQKYRCLERLKKMFGVANVA